MTSASHGAFELGTDGPRSILVGVDGSETSLRAGAYAAGLARRQGAHLYALFVRTLGGVAMSPEGLAAKRQGDAELIEELRASAVEQSRLLGVQLTFLDRDGSPYAELVRLADELRVDAVIVGASSQAGHRFVGSLAARLVRDARWPVTVVP